MALRSRGSPRASRPAVLVLLHVLLVAVPRAGAVVLATGDGTGNTAAPADDPGFANVLATGLSAVYLGNGWVISANHVPVTSLRVGDAFHRGIPESKHRLRNPRSFFRPDLAVWKLDPPPDLPDVRIRATPPAVGDPVILVGHGRDRGEPTVWNDVHGWKPLASRTIRWGTNLVFETGVDVRVMKTDLTRAFTTDFTPTDSEDATPYEAHVSNGDSGGAAFIRGEGGWELAGVLFASSGHEGQPGDLVLYGDRALIADLSYYRDEILTVTTQPACSDGLDDDGDGLVDHPADPDCESPDDRSERSG